MASAQSSSLSSQINVPHELLDSFGEACAEAGLIDESGMFNDPHKLVTFFCN
jgi:hypothetical protein